MEGNTHSSRRQRKSTSAPPSPDLARSRGESFSVSSFLENRTCSRNCRSQRYAADQIYRACSRNCQSQRYTADQIYRSNSTSRSRNRRNEENANSFNTAISITNKKKSRECDKNNNNKDGFVRFLPRGTPRKTDSGTVARKGKSVSPSAWALSPGRSPPRAMPTKTPSATGTVKVKSSGRGGGVSGVLKYFRQKKVSPVQEEEYHRFKILYNTTLQYRFANARAEAAMASMRKFAEGKLLGGCLRILTMRNFIAEKRLEVQKLKHEMKLYQILNSQVGLLNEWGKLEGKNYEAVFRVTRKISTLSVKIPFEDAKVDVLSLQKAMNTAMGVIDGIESIISKFFAQVEKLEFLLTQLICTWEHEEECLQKLHNTFALIPTLMVDETFSIVNLIQAAQKSRRSNHEYDSEFKLRSS